MKIKKFLLAAFAIVFLGSLVPIFFVYLEKEPSPQTNAQALERIKNNQGELFGFIVLGDSHTGIIPTDSTFLKVIQDVNMEGRWKKLPIDFVADLGDVTFRGSAWDYKVFNKLRSKIKWPVISAIGNHDDDNKEGAALFARYVGPRDFSFAERNSYFIFTDNNRDQTYPDEQFAWLEGELKKSQAYKHRFIFMHKSPISARFHHFYRPEVSSWSQRFMKLCEQYKVDIVFTGHEHLFREQEFGGVRYVVSGGAGMPLDVPRWEGGFLNYVVVRVNGDYVDYEVEQVFPPVWRFVTLTIWQDAFYFLRDAFFR